LKRLNAAEKLQHVRENSELSSSASHLGRSTALSKSYGRQSANILTHQCSKLIEILSSDWPVSVLRQRIAIGSVLCS